MMRRALFVLALALMACVTSHRFRGETPADTAACGTSRAT
jgi:hypothetical protein